MVKDISYIIKKILIGVGIGLILGLISGRYVVHAATSINTLDLAPSQIQVIWRNGNNYGQFNPNYNISYDGTVKSYDFTFSLTYPSKLFKVAYQYNLAGVSSDFISFYVMNNFNASAVATLNGYPCTPVTGHYMDMYLTDQEIHESILSGTTGYICRNPRVDSAWLDLNFNIDNAAASYGGGGRIRMGAAVSYYTEEQINNVINNINNNSTEIKNQTKEIKDFLKDTSQPNSSDYDFSSNNANNNVITQLITMPIILTNKMLDGFNGTCSTYVLGTIKGNTISLPCINVSSHLGVAWNIIDIIISGLFIYKLGMVLIRKFNDITNLNNNQVNEVFK